LAILVLELEDMVVRLVRPPKLAGVHGYRWTSSLLRSIPLDAEPPDGIVPFLENVRQITKSQMIHMIQELFAQTVRA
jgi:hypothetical protein